MLYMKTEDVFIGKERARAMSEQERMGERERVSELYRRPSNRIRKIQLFLSFGSEWCGFD